MDAAGGVIGPGGAARNPVLHTPYEAPGRHLRLDHRGRAQNVIDTGRRPSLPRSGIPGSSGAPELRGDLPMAAEVDSRGYGRGGGTPRAPDPDARVEPHQTINRLRELVSAWRREEWPGVSAPTRRLLRHWSDPPEGLQMRPFWCQLEAAETLIWLLEAGPRLASSESGAAFRGIEDSLEATNLRWNEGIPRLAVKLATGTGKTHLMAMVALWWASLREGPAHLLAVAPNLTVREGLRQALDPGREKRHPVWDSITPRGFERVWRRMRWSVLNFQKFQTRSGPEGMEDAAGAEKRFLTAGLPSPPEWEESETAMLARLLDRQHGPEVRFLVFNDEAHHCYSPSAGAAGKLDADELREKQAAALWFSALGALHRAGRLERVVDFSATPMWLKKPVELESEIFPWTVSDFPLLDAIESGLVKIPRVPVSDDTDSHEPRYRNIYVFAGKKDCCVGEPQAEIREPLEQLYEHYESRIDPVYQRKGVLPIFIVVANKIANAERLHRWIAGEPREEGVASPGNLRLLSNYELDGTPKVHPPTVLVHSRLFDADPPTSGKLATAIDEQAALHAPEAKTRAEKQDAIRAIFMTTGRKDAPGEHIRCVISVGMLTEGWDARNVTHIFGYRRFGSLLLCEQVTGRALRRTSFSGRDEKQSPEYANVFGVPYTFARSEADDDPQPAAQPWRVFTVPGRSGFRIAFPHVVGFAAPERIRRWRLNPDRVEPHVVPRRPTPGSTSEAGAAGRGELFQRGDRPETDLWRAAGSVAARLDPHHSQRRVAFADALGALREWLRLPEVTCPDASGIQFDEGAIAGIAAACIPEDHGGAWRPVFADERDRGEPRVSDTSAVDFETVLRHRWDSCRSELNAAACHTGEERELAAILDSHDDIEAWARNFRLGWDAPWFDADRDVWRRTEPDFIARAAGRSPERPLHLLIEFKGMKAGEASEEAKRVWLQRWCDAVSDHDEFGEWRLVWIEDLLRARESIRKAAAQREDA